MRVNRLAGVKYCWDFAGKGYAGETLVYCISVKPGDLLLRSIPETRS
jgi:hypothetical protein